MKEKKCGDIECENKFTPYNSLQKYCSFKCFKKNKKIKNKKPSCINPISKKRSKEHKIYAAKRIVFLSRKENEKCPITGEKTADIHHQKGRVGDLYLNERFWVALSRKGHKKVEENPIWAKENGYSYDRLESEYWIDAFGYEGFYEVSNYGNIRSVSRVLKTKKGILKPVNSKILSQTLKKENYLSCMLSVNGETKRFNSHRLILQSFTKKEGAGLECNHKNRKRNDNHINNLEWVTKTENVNHSIDMMSNENSNNWVITNNQVLAIRRLYKMNPNFNRIKVAEKLGVNSSQISRIIYNKRKKFIT